MSDGRTRAHRQLDLAVEFASVARCRAGAARDGQRELAYRVVNDADARRTRRPAIGAARLRAYNAARPCARTPAPAPRRRTPARVRREKPDHRGDHPYDSSAGNHRRHHPARPKAISPRGTIAEHSAESLQRGVRFVRHDEGKIHAGHFPAVFRLLARSTAARISDVAHQRQPQPVHDRYRSDGDRGCSRARWTAPPGRRSPRPQARWNAGPVALLRRRSGVAASAADGGAAAGHPRALPEIAQQLGSPKER